MQCQAGGLIGRGRQTAVVRWAGRNVGQQLFGPAHHDLEIEIALYEEYHVLRPVEAAGKGQGVFRAEGLEQFGLAQDVAPQRVAFEDEVLKVIEDKLGRRVFVRLYFVDDDFGLLLYLFLRKGGVEHNVGQQLEGTGKVFGEEGGVDDGFLLVGIGIEVAAHVLHAVQYVPGFAFLRSLEYQMLYEMGHSLLVFALVARAGIYGKTTISHL